MTCAVCGTGCKGKQFWNQDKGFGICGKCALHIRDHPDPGATLESSYGQAGVHYFFPSDSS